MGIVCVDFKEYKSGCLEGFCTIYVEKWDAEIPGCKIFSKEGRKWFSVPSKEYTDDSGDQKWQPLFRIRDKEKFKAFNTMAFQAVSEWRAANPAEAPVVQPERVTAPEDNSGGLPF